MIYSIEPLLKQITPLISGISQAYGKDCEVALYSRENSNYTILDIKNGYITDRRVGDSMMAFELDSINNMDTNKDSVHFITHTSDGRILKCTIIFIRDENGERQGCLTINMDISELVVGKKAIDNICEISDSKLQLESNNRSSISEILHNEVDDILEDIGMPVSYISKDEKVKLVETLDKRGIFLIKGAIDYVADRLCVSRYTIYNYLEEIKEKND